jgi:hypothetical protein
LIYYKGISNSTKNGECHFRERSVYRVKEKQGGMLLIELNKEYIYPEICKVFGWPIQSGNNSTKRKQIECIEIRQKKDLEKVDGIILPGGESTVQGKLL